MINKITRGVIVVQLKISRFLTLISCGIISVTLIGCGGGGGSSRTTDPGTPGVTKKWTILVYLNAANNLQSDGLLKMNQMEQIGSTNDVNIVVQWKQAACSDCGSPTWKSTRRYYVTKDNDTNTISSSLVQEMGSNVDMGSWQTLNDFVTWGEKTYPADHIAVVLWDHGSGWFATRKAGTRSTSASMHAISIDSSTNHEIETWQLANALNVPQKLDMVIFDACFMQMMEIAYELRNSTNYLVGSENTTPAAGYFYNVFLGDLTANPAMTPTQLGSSIVTSTINGYGVSSPNQQSVINTSGLTNLASKLNIFADALILHKSDSSAIMTNARNNAQSYDEYNNKDLWDYANQYIAVGVPAAIQSAAANVKIAVEGAVVQDKHGSGVPGSHGLAIYIPAASAYDTSYSKLAFYPATDWPGWLQSQP